ncbi:MAG: hypothetical protein RIR00_165 [Pseudomonadota bacterium]|jgi:two-component system cell cycle response regulator
MTDKLTILAIEPSRSFRALLGSLVEGIGYQFLGCAEVSEAESLLQGNQVDVICLSPNTSFGPVSAVLVHLRWTLGLETVPIILLTSDDKPELLRAAMEIGITEVFNKNDLNNLMAYLQVVRDSQQSLQEQSTRVLLVEDSPSVAAVIRRCLEDEGLEVQVTDNTRTALEWFHARPFEAVITDIVLEGSESGVVLIQKLRALPESGGGQVPIIALSGFADPSRRRIALHSGANLYLQKPLDLDELLLHLRHLLLTARRVPEPPPAKVQDTGASAARMQHFGLTLQEVRVADLITHGLTDKEIARELNISYWTVRTHVANIFRKCQVDNRIGLTKLCFDNP